MLHVNTGEKTDILRDEWKRFVEEPAQGAGMAAPELVELTSPYRLILSPIIDYVLDVERSRPDQQIAVLVPELDERNRCPWSQRLFDNLPTPNGGCMVHSRLARSGAQKP